MESEPQSALQNPSIAAIVWMTKRCFTNANDGCRNNGVRVMSHA